MEFTHNNRRKTLSSGLMVTKISDSSNMRRKSLAVELMQPTLSRTPNVRRKSSAAEGMDQQLSESSNTRRKSSTTELLDARLSECQNMGRSFYLMKQCLYAYFGTCLRCAEFYFFLNFETRFDNVWTKSVPAALILKYFEYSTYFKIFCVVEK